MENENRAERRLISNVAKSGLAKSRRGILVAAAVAALSANESSKGALVNDWKADTYVSGANWVDSVGNVVATQVNAPNAIPNTFGTHTGVLLSGFGQYFTVPAATAPGGSASFTLAAVFQPQSNGAMGGNWWQSSGLFGMEEGGVVNDFGLGWGNNGTQVIGGIGVQGGGDHSSSSPSLSFATHVAVLQVNAATGTQTIYVDGVQVAQDATLGAPAARNAHTYALGAITAGGANPFSGYLGEMQVYNDATVNGAALSQSLYNTYALGLAGNNTWLTGSGNYGNVGSWSSGHVPTTGEQAVIPTGATVTVDADRGSAFGVQITNGALTMAAGGALTAGIDLAPANGPGTATLNLNGGTLTAPFITVDSGTTGGTGTKAINFNGGTLATTGSFTVGGVNLTTSVAAGGATIDTQGTSVVTWQPALTPAAGASLTKLGSGTLSLTGGGFAAPVTIKAGTLNVSGDVGSATSTLQLGDGFTSFGDTAVLGITANATVLSPVNVGTAAFGSGYKLNVAANATVNFTKAVTLNQALTISTLATSGSNATTFSGGISATNPFTTLTFDNAGLVNVTTAGISDGTGSIAVVKSNNGILNFAAPNTYSLGTTINAGAIVFNAPNTIGGTGANVFVNQGGVAVVGPGFNYANLKGTFFNRVDPGSSGAIAITADSAENFDFSFAGLNMPNVFFGGATNVNYTGTITPANGTYRLYGAVGNFTLSKPNAITGVNSLIVDGALNGAVVLGAANDFTGGSTVNAGGILAVSDGSALGAGGVTLNNGTLKIIGTVPATIPQPIALNGGGTIQVENASATFTSDVGSGLGGQFIRTGTGTATFMGNVTLGTGVPLFNNGTTVFSGASTLTSTAYFSIAQGASNVATAIFQGNSTASIGTDFNVSDTMNSIGKMYVRDNASISAGTLYIGKNNTSEGSVLQSGGSIIGTPGGGEWRVGGGGAADVNAVGSYTMTGGSITTDTNFQVGAFGRGTMNMFPGSTANVNGYPVVGRFAGGYGVMSINGASFTHTNPGTFFIVGESGIGRLNVGGSGTNVGTLNLDTALRLGLNADGEGHINLLTGGKIIAPGIVAGGSTNGSSFNFHGGTLVATTPNADLMTGIKAYVYSEGAVIDTAGNDATLSSGLLAPVGSGLSSVQLATGGVGYVSHPLVQITGGGGKGATAVPVLNANGVVTGITVTNPGNGYTSAPTVALYGGGSTTPATLGTAALAPNVGGGFTKTGAGVLTLTGSSTYTGATTISGGTLKLPSAAAPASPVAIWNADSIAGNTGDMVTTWTDTVGGKVATQNGAGNLPTLALAELGTHNTVHFNGAQTQSLQVADVDSPISGATNFSIAVVFKSSTAGAGGEGQWYQNTGIVDAEQPGTTEDWGIVLNGNGRVGVGIGSTAGDRTSYSTQTGLADGTAHVVILSRSDAGTYTLSVDGQTVGGASADTTARNLSRFLFGAIQTNGNYFTGDIAQVDMFNSALNSAQVNVLGGNLAATYGLVNGFVTGPILPVASPIVFTAADGVLDISDGTVTVGSLAGVAGSQVLLGSGALTIGADNSSPTFDGLINGTGSLTKTGTGVQTLTATHGYIGATTVNNGTLRVTGSIASSSGVTVNGATATFEAAASQRVKSLTVTSGQAKITRIGPVTVLTVGDNVNSTPLSIASNGKVDLTTNAMVVDHAPGAEPATLQLVRSKIIAGYNNGTFTGNGITSSSAAGDHKKSIGYAQSSEVTLDAGNKFLGTVVDSSSVLVRYTLNGDANLDGSVGFADLVAVAQHYGQNINDPVGSPATFTNSTWTHGDFNYDGSVGFADLVAVAQNYGGALPSAVPGASADFNADMAAAFASVPEPSGALIVLGAVGLSLGRRVRSRRAKA